MLNTFISIKKHTHTWFWPRSSIHCYFFLTGVVTEIKINGHTALFVSAQCEMENHPTNYSPTYPHKYSSIPITCYLSLQTLHMCTKHNMVVPTFTSEWPGSNLPLLKYILHWDCIHHFNNCGCFWNGYIMLGGALVVIALLPATVHTDTNINIYSRQSNTTLKDVNIWKGYMFRLDLDIFRPYLEHFKQNIDWTCAHGISLVLQLWTTNKNVFMHNAKYKTLKMFLKTRLEYEIEVF
jgi:hypothetical protein